MRYAIISDVHGNLDALQAVFDAIQGERVDVHLCLGDIVGYGPQPAECIREIQRHDCTVIAGNHDFAVCGRVNVGSFNLFAREAILWTRKALGDNDVEFLARLPLVQHLDGVDLAHGSLYAPELFDYLQTSYDAHLSMELMEAPVCFVGHSHVPIAFVRDSVVSYSLSHEIQVRPGQRAIVNVGSVGQPRDKDPRASYATYDTDTGVVSLRRVRYDVEAVVTKIEAAGLPPALGSRLRVGR